MKYLDVIRAWKDPGYRDTLSSEDLSLLPPHPAGVVELSDEELKLASGVAAFIGTTAPTCTMYTFARHRCCPKP